MNQNFVRKFKTAIGHGQLAVQVNHSAVLLYVWLKKAMSIKNDTAAHQTKGKHTILWKIKENYEH